MTLFEHYDAIHQAFTKASPGTQLAAMAFAFPCLFAMTWLHEVAHLAAARCVGLKGGRLAFFALRGKSKAWFLNIMAANFEDGPCVAVGPARLRVAIAAGPVCHTALTVLCVYIGLSLPGPAWFSLGVAVSGAFYAPFSLINFIPLPFGTDGWKFIVPITDEMRAAARASGY